MAWKRKNECMCLNNKVNFPVTERKHYLHHYLVILNATQWLWHVQALIELPLWICKSLQFLWNYTAIWNRIVWKYFYHIHSRKEGEYLIEHFIYLQCKKIPISKSKILKITVHTPNQGRTLFSFHWNIMSERGFHLIENNIFIIYYLALW